MDQLENPQTEPPGGGSDLNPRGSSAARDGLVPTPSDPSVAGDQIVVGNVDRSIVAVGAGARAMVKNIDTYIEQYVERELTAAEEAERARAIEHKQLAEAVKKFIESIGGQLGEAQQAGQVGNPYKYVHPYELADADRFAGRDALTDALLDKMVCPDSLCRFVVLDGGAKVGKTSLIRAGIMPSLVAARHLPLYVDMTPGAVDSLSTLVKQTLLPDLGATPFLAEAPLREFIRKVADLLPKGKRVFVLLDQFEATLSMPVAMHAAFARSVSASLRDEDPRDHWLISIRAARTSELNQLFQPTIRFPLSNTLKVPYLSRHEARAAVVEPAHRYGFVYEDNLVEKLLDDLGDQAVDPSYLQVLCYALVEALPSGERRLSLRTYENLGGAVGVMGSYLDRTMEYLAPSHREPGWLILSGLAEEPDATAARSRLASRLHNQGFGENELEDTLGRLDGSGLLRNLHDGLQLANPHFIPRIRDWAREWASHRAVSEHIRTEFRRQAEHILGSALRGTLGGAFGFGLAFWLAFLNQGLRHLFPLTLFRLLPGALAGLIAVICSDVAMASLASRKGRWMPWVWAGAGGAFGFGLALAYHFLLLSPEAYSNLPWRLLATLVPAAVEGGLWGLATGLGIVWIARGRRPWKLTSAKVLAASAIASVVLSAADAVIRGVAVGGALLGSPFARPDPPGLLLLAGAVMPLSVIAAYILPALRPRRQLAPLGDEP